MSVSDTQWLPPGAIHARLQGATGSPFASEHVSTGNMESESANPVEETKMSISRTTISMILDGSQSEMNTACLY